MKLKDIPYCLAVFSILIINSSCSDKAKALKPEIITLTSVEDIIPLTDSLVRPVHYHNIPLLDTLPVAQAKEAFIAIVLPAVLIAKYHLQQDHIRLTELQKKDEWTLKDSSFYNNEISLFEAKDMDDLLVRIKTHPNSIVLAQAAVESGWGSSRFFREANNLFGIWSYKADEDRIPAEYSNAYLRKYPDISQSVEDYFITLGRATPYASFRKERTNTDEAVKLLPYLKYYSERGLAYTYQLKTIIRQNDLTKYDGYKLDPSYFVEE